MPLIRAFAILLGLALGHAAQAQDSQWPHFGNDEGGQRFSPLTQIDRGNVGGLVEAWRYSTGEMARRGFAMRRSAFEATPILAAGHLVFCTPFNRVVALDPANGAERWVFDPEVKEDFHAWGLWVCRGLTQWIDSNAPLDAPCRHRLFMATMDLRLIALDARDGKPCAGFGEGGTVRVIPDMAQAFAREFTFGSPPIVVGDTLIVGSEIADNYRVRAPAGTVRAYDARSGAPRWTFEPIRDAELRSRIGHANVWAPMSADSARGLVFLPTSSASPDHYGGGRIGDNRDANSVVALRAATGERVWAFQTTHHDLWDFDLPSMPALFSLRREGRTIDAVLQPTKQGFLFVLDRETGLPLHPVKEVAVPQSDVPGEQTAPTQPVPLRPPPLVPQSMRAEDAWGVTPTARDGCRRQMEHLRADGFYTPPSLRGTLVQPALGGGANWGGAAIDPRRNIAVINLSNLAYALQLVPTDEFGGSGNRQIGAPYAVSRPYLRSLSGLPCNPPPWGVLAAVDLDAGTILWRVPLGDIPAAGQPNGQPSGTANVGGPLITAAGLIFIGATNDRRMRAFELDSGRQVWSAALPASAQSGPMTYEANGRQFVVIAAGGHAWLRTPPGDEIVAFALPK